MKTSNKKHTAHTKSNHIPNLILSIFFGAFRRFFGRFFFLPLYGALAIPWIILFVENASKGLEEKVYGTVAVLAGKPGATMLDEKDIGLVVLMLFVIIDVIAEIISCMRGTVQAEIDKTALKRRMYIQWVISVVGWTALGISKIKEEGYELALIMIVSGFLLCAFYLLEYHARITFAETKAQLFPNH